MVKNEHGMVTAETAVVIPTLLFITCLLAGMLWIQTAHAQTNETAQFIARSMSQGDSKAQAMRRVGESSRGLKVRVREESGTVSVHVSRRVTVPSLPRIAVTVQGNATAVQE